MTRGAWLLGWKAVGPDQVSCKEQGSAARGPSRPGQYVGGIYD